ncbi:uncharacterized protein FRV6_10230 [Fusarium oxysporum]|uniref:Uncharacterized protein n=1 Tax=Fusarium oxysporum TaxID=5507 RepID=A0A2H3TBL4_FUSOX|nr:uncharacterized protein FRV6_10230 [Fusarium oxysporum]
MPPNLEDNLIDTKEEEEEEIALAHPSSHEEEVTKLRHLAEALRAEAEKSQKLYKEHIKHTQALVATGKDPREIL